MKFSVALQMETHTVRVIIGAYGVTKVRDVTHLDGSEKNQSSCGLINEDQDTYGQIVGATSSSVDVHHDAE